jgi:hypothetical protein
MKAEKRDELYMLLFILLWPFAVISCVSYIFNVIFGVNFFDIGLLL